MARKVTIWGAEQNLAALQAMYEWMNLSKQDIIKIALACRTKGYHFSGSALAQHLQKLRRKDTAANDGPAEGSSANAPETPAKARGGKAAAKKTPGSNKRKGQAAAAGDNGTDNEEADPTPAPKKRRGVKKEAPKSDTIVKKEDSEDDQDSYGQPRAATTVYSADASRHVGIGYAG
ncbi:hypothetical protein QC763_0090820 [Podospora pseudopauciseta]|uniref:Uncharacterized protein n=1 Tax=Podospora pseudopauciseta TaxID=2093780 RepID=A0ABR0H450_9PEZI|nr:hypothetical protein QC763_0090820 [Podospora pseudopauciseta]